MQTTNPPRARCGVLFDLDGTLLDTAADFVRVLNQLRGEENLKPLTYMQVRPYVSNGARAMVTRGLDLQPEDAGFDAMLERFLLLYSQGLAIDTKPFPGIADLLDWLQALNIPWGIVTNKLSIYTAPIISALDLDSRCAATVCPDHVSNRKPDPESLLLACNLMNCDPENSIYIGDHSRDVQAGHRAGMATVAAAWGYVHPDDPIHSWGADCISETVDDLIPILQTHFSVGVSSPAATRRDDQNV